MGSVQKWTKDSIKSGLEKFFAEFGRYPTAEEIDAYPNLPSSRQIQRSFGGLINLRQEFGLEVSNYTVGKSRSKVAALINQRGSIGERDIEQELIKHFGEHFVHVEKLIGVGKRRADFFVYSREKTFAVDVFYANNYRGLINIINIKLLAYSQIGEDLYLVNLNETSDISDKAIETYLTRRKTAIPEYIKLMNKSKFLKHIAQYSKLNVI